jgi:hypothetical protein
MDESDYLMDDFSFSSSLKEVPVNLKSPQSKKCRLFNVLAFGLNPYSKLYFI